MKGGGGGKREEIKGSAMPFTNTKQPKPNLLTYQRRGKRKDASAEVSLGGNISVIELNEP